MQCSHKPYLITDCSYKINEQPQLRVEDIIWHMSNIKLLFRTPQILMFSTPDNKQHQEGLISTNHIVKVQNYRTWYVELYFSTELKLLLGKCFLL